jgi:flagella basal body P-ring formation protein FlgA
MTREGRRRRGNRRAITQIVLVVAALAGVFDAGASRAGETIILPVPKLTIYPGDTIGEDWLVDREFTSEFVAARPALVDSRDAIVGKVSRRTLLPGAPVPTSAISERKLVVQGAKVRIVFEDGGLTIVAIGTALQSGSAGSNIPVRNLDSGVTISGTVERDGSIRVSGG